MSTNTDDIISGGLFAPIEQLKLNDTFYTWFNTTNTVLDALNPLAIYDVASGPGINVTKISGGVAVITVNTGCGLRFDSNVSLCVDIDGTPETTEAGTEDYYLIERFGGTNITTDSADCETLFKIQATNLLPYIVSGDHDFIGGTESLFKVSSTFFTIDSDTVEFKTSNIFLNNNPETTNTDFVNRVDINFAGFTVHADDEAPTLGFNGSLLAWKSNQNFSVISDRSFVSDSLGTSAAFNFSTKTVDQQNVSLKLLTGDRTSDNDIGKVFTLNALNSLNKFSLIFENESDTLGETTLFHATYNMGLDQTSFEIEGKIYIRDIEDSSQFLISSDYSSHKVPITNTDGVVDYKFTNRFVTSNYDPSLEVGDVVRFEFSASTNTTEDIYVVASRANTEENSKVVGIVEAIDGGNIIIALTGVFNYGGVDVAITSGTTFYLSAVLAGKITSTEPVTGIVKEVFVGISPTKGILLTSGVTKEPFYSKVQISGGDLVEAESAGDTLNILGGTNVNIEYNTNNEIVINAGTLFNADFWTTISVDSGDYPEVAANGPAQQLFIYGGNGASTETNGMDTITIVAPNSYGSIQIVGENTDELDYTLSADSGSDVLTIRSGVGINITSSTNNDLIIEAIGVSIPANRSVGNLQLEEMPAYSVKVAQADGAPVDVYQSAEFFEISYPILADHYDVYQTTDNITVYQDPITLIEYPSLYSSILEENINQATPDAISGFVFGRVLDEAGNVSDIKTLNRRELRLILGASETGFIQENDKVFNSVTAYHNQSNIGEYTTFTAESKSGTLRLLGGVGIILSESTAVGPYSPGILITATGDTARFGIITNTTTSESHDAAVIGSTLYVTERDAVGIDINTNDGLDFYIKSGSITNDMLADMLENTVKVNNGGTNDSTPSDLYIDEDEILGRLSGEGIKSLTATEARGLLGFSSADFFKKVSCYTGNILVGDADANSGETLVLRGGTNITLTVLGDESIRIDAETDDEISGIKTIGFSKYGTIYSPTHLVLDGVSLSGQSGIYQNIDIIPSFNSSTDTLTTTLDIGAMPQRSVKVAAANYTSSRSGFLASNLIIQQGHVLGVTPSGTTTSSISFANVVANSGLNYYSTASVNGFNISAVGAAKLKFVSGGDVSLGYDGSNITISSQTNVESDTAPKLGANLEIDSKFITQSYRKSLYVTNTLTSGTNHYLNIDNAGGKVDLKVLRDTSSATAIDLILSPYGTGIVLSKTFGSNSLNNLTLKTGTSDGKIYVDGNNSTHTIISSTQNKNLYLSPGTDSTDINLYFYDGATAKSIIARRNGSDTAIIHSSAVGDLVLCAGYTGSTISFGNSNIKMYSDIMMHSSKVIASEDDIVKFRTTDDGYLRIYGTNKSATHKIYSNNFNSVTTRVIDAVTINTLGNAFKYTVRGINPSNSADMFVTEFNVIVTGSEVVQDVISKIYSAAAPANTQNVVPSIVSNGTTLTVSLNTIVGSYTLTVYRTSLI